MLGGRDQKLTPKDSEISPQLPINPRAMVISDQSAALNLAGQNSPHVFVGEGMQNGELIQQAGSIIIHSKQLQDDLQELGQKIKHNEDNIKYLKTQKTKLEESILDMTATLEKHHKTSFSATQNQYLDLSKSEEETLSNILKHEKSAAALLCMIKNQPESQASDHTSTKDVLGIVATLGKVEDDNLSRLLSEYLGLETMLAVVCKTYEGVNALEAYNKEGSINKSLGLHALATSTRRSLDDPFLVICLETLGPYPGEFIADDPQRRLDLLKPRIINGETPPGFLGFAVNMINIDRSHLYYITKSGFGLRETLFYNLLSRLQVYKSREDMLKALPYIPDGAISLDGGMIKSPGVFRLAPPREDVKFPVGFERLSLPEKFLEIENQIKETKWKKDQMAEDLMREQSYLDHAKVNYEIKKQEFLKFLAESSMYTAQIHFLLPEIPFPRRRSILIPEILDANSIEEMANQNLVYLPRKLGRDAIFRCKLTLESRYKEIAEKIHRYLNNNERAFFFEKSPFGNLVRYHRDFNLSSQIIWYLMSNQIVDTGSDELWMVVRKRPIRFSLLEYCLITGLDCALEPEDLPDGGAFGTRHFAGKSEIVLSDLEAKISVQVQNETGIDVEKLKMASLYFCCAVFGEGTRKKTMKINPKYLRLVDELDRFNTYPWGRVAYRDAVRCLKKDLLGRYTYLTEAQGRKEVDGTFLVGGFVLPLQILAYEYYPSVAQKFAKRRDVDGLMLPRMFQWVTNTWPSNHAPSAVDVSAAFGDCAIDDCLGCLTPTLEELVSPYYTTGVFVDSAPDAVITRVLELWRQGQTVICSEHPLESPSVQHTHLSPDGSGTPSAHLSPDGSSTRSVHATRSSSSTSSPIRMGPRVHFGLEPSGRPSPLEHLFERRLTALEDSVTSMRLEMRAGFIETRACIKNINLAFDELRSSLTEQIRAGFAEIRSHTPGVTEIRSPTPVHEGRDYSITYSRGRKRKSYEADFGVEDNMAREIGSSSQARPQPIFEPSLPIIIEESSENEVTRRPCREGIVSLGQL